MDDIIIVKGYSNPTRLDRFLREYFKGLTQGLIEKALRKGQIKVAGQKASTNLRVQDNMEIHLVNFNFEQSRIEPHTPSIEAIKLADLILNKYKIFENDDMLVINKPNGIAVQGGSKVKLSIDDALKYLNLHGGNYKITHRLDKETSGLLLIAKSKDAAYKLFTGFKGRLIRKTYLAVLDNVPNKPSGQISSNISKIDSKHYQKVSEDFDNGKLAITHYLVKDVINNYALTEFKPLTGRMHQIRVHAKSLNCPILGDRKYGDPSSKYKELFLHASELILPKELFGKEYIFKAPLLEYWTDVLKG